MIEQIMIFAFCIIGVGITSYNIGIRKGAETMFDHMCALGVKNPETNDITITVDQDG